MLLSSRPLTLFSTLIKSQSVVLFPCNTACRHNHRGCRSMPLMWDFYSPESSSCSINRSYVVSFNASGVFLHRMPDSAPNGPETACWRSLRAAVVRDP